MLPAADIKEKYEQNTCSFKNCYQKGVNLELSLFNFHLDIRALRKTHLDIT